MNHPRCGTSAALWGLVFLSGCGGAGLVGSAPDVVGRLRYEARHPTSQGASAARTVHPARHVEVLLLGDHGQVVDQGQTDAQGRFSLHGRGSRLRFSAHARLDDLEAWVSTDANGEQIHQFELPLPPAGFVEVLADDARGWAGPFHITDTLLTGLAHARSWSGRPVAPVFAYWVRGGTRVWSYYRGELPAGSGRYGLELLGGDPGHQSVSDTDEHDEGIVLHELGHFVMDFLTSDSSSGGSHPRGVLVEPGLAWEEGRATWFALAVLNDPQYRDTVGVEPWGSLRVDEDMESGRERRGLGSETSTTRVLWDLSDGGPGGLVDRDDDGIAMGPAAVLRAMMSLAERPGAFPCLSSFLAHLAESGRVRRDELAAWLGRIDEPQSLLPERGYGPWPRFLPLEGSVSAKIDGRTQPAPSGGPNLPATGFDAVHSYRVQVEQRAMLTVRLSVRGSGRRSDYTDLDLEILDLDADRLARSRTQRPVETVTIAVNPGWYIVRVRDAGNGNDADYELSARVESLSFGR